MTKEKDYKSLYESADAVITFISKRMYKLEQENERLKEQLNANPLWSDSWNNRLRADKYKSALEEIREIAENISPCKLEFDKEHCFRTDCNDCIQEKIRSIINEVLNENSEN